MRVRISQSTVFALVVVRHRTIWTRARASKRFHDERLWEPRGEANSGMKEGDAKSPETGMSLPLERRGVESSMCRSKCSPADGIQKSTSAQQEMALQTHVFSLARQYRPLCTLHRTFLATWSAGMTMESVCGPALRRKRLGQASTRASRARYPSLDGRRSHQTLTSWPPGAHMSPLPGPLPPTALHAPPTACRASWPLR